MNRPSSYLRIPCLLFLDRCHHLQATEKREFLRVAGLNFPRDASVGGRWIQGKAR